MFNVRLIITTLFLLSFNLMIMSSTQAQTTQSTTYDQLRQQMFKGIDRPPPPETTKPTPATQQPTQAPQAQTQPETKATTPTQAPTTTTKPPITQDPWLKTNRWGTQQDPYPGSRYSTKPTPQKGTKEQNKKQTPAEQSVTSPPDIFNTQETPKSKQKQKKVRKPLNIYD